MKPEDALAQYKNLFYVGQEVGEQKEVIIRFSRERCLVVSGSEIEVYKDIALTSTMHRLKDVKFSKSRKEDGRMGLRLEFKEKSLMLAIDIIGKDLRLAGSLDEPGV